MKQGGRERKGKEPGCSRLTSGDGYSLLGGCTVRDAEKKQARREEGGRPNVVSRRREKSHRRRDLQLRGLTTRRGKGKSVPPGQSPTEKEKPTRRGTGKKRVTRRERLSSYSLKGGGEKGRERGGTKHYLSTVPSHQKQMEKQIKEVHLFHWAIGGRERG